MPSGLLSLLAGLGSGVTGYSDENQVNDQRQTPANQLAILQALYNTQQNNPSPTPQGPGQASVPSISQVPQPPQPLQFGQQATQLPPQALSVLQGAVQPPPAQNQLITPVPRPQTPPLGPGGPPPQVQGAALPLPVANNPLPGATPMPQRPPVQQPQPQAQPAQMPGNDYQGIVSRVVAAVNQALPNATPQQKAMAAMPIIQNMQQQAAEQQKLAFEQAAAARQDRAESSRERYQDAMEQAALQNANTRGAAEGEKEKQDAATNSLKERAAATRDQVTLTGKSIAQKGQALVDGASYTDVGLTNRSANNPNKDAVDLWISENYPDFDRAGAIAKQKGAVAGQQTGARRGMSTAQGVGELDELAPAAKESIAKLDTTKYPTLNAMINSTEYQNGDPDVVEAINNVQEAQNAYASIIARGGQGSDAKLELSQQTVNMNMSPEQAIRALDTMVANSQRIMKGITKAQAGKAGQSSDAGIPPPPPGFKVQQ